MSPRRTQKIEVIVNPDEKSSIRRFAKDQGKSMSAFLRERGLTRDITAPEAINRTISCVDRIMDGARTQCTRPLPVDPGRLRPPPPPPGKFQLNCQQDPDRGAVICELKEMIAAGKIRRIEE